MFYQMIRRAFTCGLRGMLCKLFFMFLKHTAMWLFEIKTCRWTWESRGVRAGPCSVYINLTYRGGEWEARCFKDDACGAKWANEELCTFFRRTNLFQHRRLHFYIYIYIPRTTWKAECSPIIKWRTHLVLFSRGEIWPMMESRRHIGKAAVALVKVHRSFITLLHRRLFFLWLSCTCVAPAIIGRELREK